MMAAHKTSLKKMPHKVNVAVKAEECTVMSEKNANTGGYGSKHIIGSHLILIDSPVSI